MFPDEQRAIYKLEWEGATRYIDPMLTLRNLDLLAGGSLDELLTKVGSAEYGIAEPATLRLGYAVVTAFKLGAPFNPETGTGVPYGAWVKVLNDFTDWLSQKKTAGVTSPTSAASTEEVSRQLSGFVSDTSIGSRSI